MKYFKKLSVAAVMAAALFVVAGAGTASAAELYSTGVKLKPPVNLVFSLEAGTTALLASTSEALTDTCTKSTVEAEVEAYGGENITTGIDSLAWPECVFTTHTHTNGVLSIASDSTVSSWATVVTITFSGAVCRYGTGTGTTLGKLNTGKLGINIVVTEQEPKKLLCPDTTRWTANYVVTAPHDLTVK